MIKTIPPRKSRTMPARLRRNALLFFTTLFFLLLLVVSLYEIDKNYYQMDKREIMDSLIESNELFNKRLQSEAADAVKQWASRRASPSETSADQERREQLQENAFRALDQFFEQSTTLYFLKVETPTGRTLYERHQPEIMREYNNFSNSLILRSFDRTIVTHIRDKVGGEEQIIATIRWSFTNPLDNGQIQALTVTYRWIMIGVVFLIGSLYIAMVRGVLLPTRRLIIYLDRPDDRLIPIMPAPQSLLERAYNNLARDAILSRLSIQLRERILIEGLTHPDPIFELFPVLVKEMTGVSQVVVATFSWSDSQSHWVPEATFQDPQDKNPGANFQDWVLGRLWNAKDESAATGWEGAVKEWPVSPDQTQLVFTDVLFQMKERLTLLFIHLPDLNNISPWWQDFFAKLSRELRFATRNVESQRRLILKEKSKANISLSRNLGHDLTNIIATSKLELMTIKSFLSLKPSELHDAPAKEKIFRESLEAILNNTRFLQEIVNLYRSFSYLQRPKFEEVDVSELVEDVAELFKLSLSKSFKVNLDLARNLPPCKLEPRLIRLALFNLMTNAADAIKQASSVEKPEGEIFLQTALSENRRSILIRVADSGPGIRDARGNLVSSDQLPGVFRLGYSTKKDLEGEGLGLNWVQTIVREFHGGNITAENRPEGGAQFTIRLPESHLEIPDSDTFSRSHDIVEQMPNKEEGIISHEQ